MTQAQMIEAEKLADKEKNRERKAVREAKLEFPIEDWYFISTDAIDMIQKLLCRNVKKCI